jgi:hypothetical protein
VPAAFAFPSIIRAASITFIQPAAVAGPSYLVSNDLTGGSLPSGWSDQSGSPNWAYDATGLGMIGNTVLELDGTAATESVDHPAFTDTSDIWVFFQYHSITRPGSAREIFRFLVSAAQADGCEIQIDASGRLILVNGTISCITATGMTLNTTYNCWVHFKSETSNGAADGLGLSAFSTSTTRPSSDGGGNGYAAITNGTGFTAVDQVRLTAQFSTSGPRGLYAKLRVDDAEIGNNPT